MKNIFVIGLDHFNRQMLRTVSGSEEYRFHGLLAYDQVVNPAHYPVEEMIEAGRRELDRFDGSVDAIVGHWDFPGTALMAIFREHCGLHGPSLTSVLLSEHKYWCRLKAKEAIPEHIPAFEAVNPFAHDAAERIGLDYPFWIKPTIAFSSQLAFKVRNREELDHALAELRRGIGRFGEPFGALLGRVELPHDIPAEIDGFHAVAEQAISGELSTVEGFIHDGMTTVYGIVDSYREGKHRSCFSRYQLPSRIPSSLEERIIDTTRRVVPELWLDDTPFNIEYFWDPETEEIWLLELNPRLSKSHSPMFAAATGSSHHEVAIDIALGRAPRYPRNGRSAVAAKFMLRRHKDARVARVPELEELKALEAEYPDTHIEIAVEEGQQLSDLRGQDAYSFEVAVVFMGGDDTESLVARYEELRAKLDLRFEDLIADKGEALHG